MTSDEVKAGCEVTLRVAHRLRDVLGRYPTSSEIQWRLATQFQAHSPVQAGPRLSRHQAMKMAQQMMAVVSTAIQYDQESPNGN